MRLALPLTCALALSGCTVETFGSATRGVNEEFALAQQLRDRCDGTGDVDHCLAWQQYRQANGVPGYNYDAMLDRWIERGPY